MRHTNRATLTFALAAGLAACSGGDDTDAGIADTGPRDTGASSDSGIADSSAADSGGTTSDAGFPDSGVGDMNDDFDEAFDARKNTDTGFRGAINPPGDRDYYHFEGTAGEFVRVFTNSTVTSDDNQVDTVIRLYNSSFEQVAENDDAVPRVNVNSEVIYRLPADGRYYIEILEWSDWAGETPEGRADFAYQLLVRTVNARNAGTTIEVEAGDDAASAIDAELLDRAGLVCGGFDDNTDVDVYHLNFGTEADGRRLYVQAMPDGTDGHGGTSPIGNIWLTDASGMDVIARLDLSGDLETFTPAAGPGEYLLWLQHPGTPAGANDFYVFKPFLFLENDPEVEPNNDLATADRRVLEPRETQMDRANFVLAHLPDGDVDYFAIEPTGNETVTVVCGSGTAGSGVQGLTLDLLDATGAMIATVTESDTEVAFIEDQVVTSTTVYLRLSKTGQDPTTSGDFVRCGLIASP